MNESQTELWIDPILYTGRPEASSPRSPDEWAVYDFLDSLHISYQRLDHDATPTIAFCEKVEERLGTEICKNLFLCNRQKTDFYLLVMPGKNNSIQRSFPSRLVLPAYPLAILPSCRNSCIPLPVPPAF